MGWEVCSIELLTIRNSIITIRHSWSKIRHSFFIMILFGLQLIASMYISINYGRKFL